MLRNWILMAVAALGVALTAACAQMPHTVSADACKSSDAALGAAACASGYTH